MIYANTSTLDSKLQRIMQSGRLYDLMGAKHGLHSPNTHIRGTKTIDYMLGTQRVLNAVEKCGIRALNSDILSDHRVLWVDLNVQTILRQKLQPIQTRPSPINSKNKPWLINARTRTSLLLRKHGVQQAIKNLYESINNNEPRSESIQTLETIEENIYKDMLSSADSYNRYKSWWSPNLHHAFLTKKNWLLRRTELMTKVSMKTQLNETLQQLQRNSTLHDLQYS